VEAAFVLAVVAALAFAFTNGVHDAANAIATLVATRGASPGAAAITLAAVFNLLGPLLVGAAVANPIATIVEVPAGQTVEVVGAALTAAVTWNLFMWRRGLPSSSSHALVGGWSGPGGRGGVWGDQLGECRRWASDRGDRGAVRPGGPAGVRLRRRLGDGARRPARARPGHRPPESVGAASAVADFGVAGVQPRRQ
jgi:hypothetical protein